MTEEELYRVLCGVLKSNEHFIKCQLDEFFNSNVVIPRGENRHPDADAIHHLAERPLEVEIKLNEPNSEWAVEQIGECSYRIKPSEPVWEFLVCMHFTDGTFELTNGYFTQEEFYNYGFPSSCELAYDTKRGRR